MHTHDTIKKRIAETNKVLGASLGDSIQPFREECPAKRRKIDKRGNTNLNAHDLFNRFTADIIKINVIFIR